MSFTRSLRARLLLLVACAFLVLGGVIFITVSTIAHGEISRVVQSDVQATNGLLAQFINERGSRLREQSRLMASLSYWKALVQDTDRATMDDALKDTCFKLGADGVLFTDRQGRAVGQASTGPDHAMPLPSDPGIASALQGDAWTGVVADRGRLRLTTAVPVTVNGIVWGTLSASTDIDSREAAAIADTLNTDVAFVCGGKVVGASTRVPNTLTAPSDVPKTLELNGNEYLCLYSQFPQTDPQTGAGFIALRSKSAAFAPFASFQTVLALVLTIATMLAMGIAVFVARGITRPLDSVVRAAEAVRDGEWPEPFGSTRSDEIGLLQNVFDNMMASLQASQERLLSLIDTDPLTELSNHRCFREHLEREVARCRVSGEALSLLLIDLDRFNEFNQTRGHQVGDQVLQSVARTLWKIAPDVGVAARYGGEEFVVLLPGIGIDEAETIAGKVASEIAEQLRTEFRCALTVSIGCTELGADSEESSGLILSAELALVRAKQLGRNRVCRFGSEGVGPDHEKSFELHKFLEDGSYATIRALAAAVDAKDPYTRGHSERVADYAADLARVLRLPNEEVELIHVTGTLHDVGKIGVPDAILQKPDRLTDEERAIMETHPALGEVIVRKVPQLAATLDGVRHHHERWDGRGYPDGLSGETIPRNARILALADTFDAMTSDRPYRKGLDFDTSIDEIARNAGVQFDPEMAKLFVDMMRRRRELPRAA